MENHNLLMGKSTTHGHFQYLCYKLPESMIYVGLAGMIGIIARNLESSLNWLNYY